MSRSPLAVPSVPWGFESRRRGARVAGFDCRLDGGRARRCCATRRTGRRPFVTEAARHLVEAGGKRFRPLLVLLAAQFGIRPRRARWSRAAVVVELTHLATLYHDDVMDEAPLRRGAASANARWANSVAILTGDYLFARASDLAADLGPEAVRIQARTFARLVAARSARPSARRGGTRWRTTSGDRGQDRLADRHVGPLRRSLRRCRPPRSRALTGFGETIGVGVPALRRPARHRLGAGRVGQDARHRPARRRADPAGALRALAIRPTPRTPGCASCSTPDDRRRRASPRRSGCCASHPAHDSRPGRRTPPRAEDARELLTPCPRARPATPSSPSADLVVTRSV